MTTARAKGFACGLNATDWPSPPGPLWVSATADQLDEFARHIFTPGKYYRVRQMSSARLAIIIDDNGDERIIGLDPTLGCSHLSGGNWTQAKGDPDV